MYLAGRKQKNDCGAHIYQLFDEVGQNIVICQWRADQLFADGEEPSSIIVLSFTYTASFYVSRGVFSSN